MKPPSTVSVIMAVYNGQQYVLEALNSVLKQKVESLEFIIIDDGSTDNTVAIIKSTIATVRLPYKISLYQQSNHGLAASQNWALTLATGKYISFMDADDIWEPNKLERQLGVLTAQPALDMVFGHVLQFHSPELSAAECARILCPSQPQVSLMSNSMLATKSIFDKVGYFDTSWRKGPFIDWFARTIEAKARYIILPEVVYHRRLHKNNMGIINRRYTIDYVRILKASLDRRRLLVD